MTVLKTLVLVPCAILLACVGAEEGAPESDETKSDDAYGEIITVKQECVNADEFGIADSFTLEYKIDSTTKRLVSDSIAVNGFSSDVFELEQEPGFASDETYGTLTASNWHVSSEMMTFSISDRDNGTLGDFQLVLTRDYDGERAIGFLKFTSDGYIGSSLVECGDFPFDDVLAQPESN
jgi:hypothetical protein